VENFLPAEDSLRLLVVKELPTVMGMDFSMALRILHTSRSTNSLLRGPSDGRQDVTSD
jgi:hypothetical protein